MDKVQEIRNLVRPVLTIMVALGYYGVTFIATWKGMLSGKEAMAAVTAPFLMMMTYHFAKASKKDST